MAFKVILSYDGAAKDRLDRGHYCNNHVPHGRKVWEPLGMLHIRPYFPGIESAAKGIMSISQCVFWDKAAMEAAFAAPDTQALMDDVPNIPDLPMQGRLPSPMENGVAQPAVLA